MDAAQPTTTPELGVVHADAWLVALDKPPGLLSVPGLDPARDSLHAQARRRWPEARIVHRLDMATSGLMLFGLGAATQRSLSMAFEARRVRKHYVAVVHGLVGADAGTIDAPIAADWPRRPLQVIDAMNGRPSVTHWRVLAREPSSRTTRLALEPVTGRAHQLRVHLQSIGHPIVGDALYAAGHPGAARMLLHAEGLCLVHPGLGSDLTLCCPAPF